MNKLYTLLCAMAFVIIAKSETVDIIPNASYVVLENATDTGGVTMPCRWADYYTFDGKRIARIDYEWHGISHERKKLDPSAPKPRPTTYKINHYVAIKFYCGPQDWIVFYDCHGNSIGHARYVGPARPTKDYIAAIKTLCFSGGSLVEKRLDEILDLSIVEQVV